MKAMLSVQAGGPETLTLTELPTPAPGPGEVLIEVQAAGVNYPDTLMIEDRYQFKPPRPFAPGGEVSGVVLAVGDEVVGTAPGDRVAAMVLCGGYATHLCAPVQQCLKIPESMPFEHAAAFTLTYGTSYHALSQRGQLQKGETLFITGAAGGVGAAAIEIGKAMGARVIAAVSSEQKAEFCRQLGADETLVYSQNLDKSGQKSLAGEIKALVGKGGIDVAYDAVGGDYAEPVIRSMAFNGRFLVVGFPAGIPAIPLNLTLLKSCQIVGVFWGQFCERQPKLQAENMAQLYRWYQQGKVSPRVQARFALPQAADALNLLRQRAVMGKAVILPGDG